VGLKQIIANMHVLALNFGWVLGYSLRMPPMGVFIHNFTGFHFSHIGMVYVVPQILEMDGASVTMRFPAVEDTAWAMLCLFR